MPNTEVKRTKDANGYLSDLISNMRTYCASKSPADRVRIYKKATVAAAWLISAPQDQRVACKLTLEKFLATEPDKHLVESVKYAIYLVRIDANKFVDEKYLERRRAKVIASLI